MSRKLDDSLLSPVSSSSSSSEDLSLDFSSEKFDPLRALYSKNCKIKSKNYAKYDNLAMFERALVKFGLTNVGAKQKPPQEPTTTQSTQPVASTSNSTTGFDDDLMKRRFLPHQRPISSSGLKNKHKRNLLKKIEKFDGPLGALRNFIEIKKKIIVYTRKEHGIRGTITGYLLCFDKHWNLLLSDATETWKRRKYKFSENNTICGTPPVDCSNRLKKLGIKIPQTEVKNLSRKYVECTRKVNQIMIRGEQVVLVVSAADENKLEST